MKKLFGKNLFLLLCFVFLFINAGIVCAQCGPAIGVACNPLNGTVDTLSEGVVVVIRYLLSIVGIISLIFIVISGVKYMTSVGNEEKMKSAKDAFLSSATGLAIAIMAFVILEAIVRILNG
ncbi:MAG: hypothetical protein U9P70_04640 [Patescibacteria group bacterium]|nr:hypothetical protein [Patescibacteria group bacterium]